MNGTIVSTDITETQHQEVTRTIRQMGIDFDAYAYFTMISDMGQSHDSAFAFAQVFRLQPVRHMEGGDLEADMDEMSLTLALSRKCVTVEELVEYDSVITEDETIKLSNELVALRNSYLRERLNGMSHATAMRI